MQRPRSPIIDHVDTHQLMQHVARLAPSALMIDSRDLVARALAILAEETEAWHARRASNP
jgi:hypothetical protein